jgi:hypothetical protein
LKVIVVSFRRTQKEGCDQGANTRYHSIVHHLTILTRATTAHCYFVNKYFESKHFDNPHRDNPLDRRVRRFDAVRSTVEPALCNPL